MAPSQEDGSSYGTDKPRLPTEILLIISKFSSFNTLKKLRLVDPVFDNSAVNARIFEDVYLGPFEYSVNNLVQISKSTKVSGFVRRLVVCGAHLKDLPYEEWKAKIAFKALNNYEDGMSPWEAYEQYYQSFTTRHETIKDNLLRGRNLEESYRRYVAAVQHQGKFRSSAKAMLHEACQSLNALDQIDMEDDVNLRVERSSNPLWLNLWSKILILPQFDLQSHDNDYTPMTDFVMSCLASGRVNPSNLKLMVYNPILIGLGHFGEVSLRQIFYKVVHVQLAIKNFDVSNGWQTTSINFGLMFQAFQHAANLKSLKLSVRDEVCVARLLNRSDSCFVNLEELEISFYFIQWYLLRFLSNHADTLRRLSFKHATLFVQEGGSWEEVLTKVPQILKLQDIKVYGLWNIPHLEASPSEEEFNTMTRDNQWTLEYTRHVIHGSAPPTFDPHEWFSTHPMDWNNMSTDGHGFCSNPISFLDWHGGPCRDELSG